MPSLRFSRVGLNLSLLDINFAQVFIAFAVLLFSLTFHEMAHAWTADRLGDPTARLLGRVSFNPIVHADPIGTVLFPLLAIVGNLPIIGWAKPVPVVISRLRRKRRDYVLVAAAGPASNLVLAVGAALILAALPVSPVVLGEPNRSAPVAAFLSFAVRLNILLAVFNMLPIPPLDGGNVLGGLLPHRFATMLDKVRPYGFLLLYALLFTDGFYYLVVRPSNFLRSWLP
ncbi:MAG TPA: site-2 protease family protein [Vicinamibacterales bacterium]|jgi:Zn-dependent protease